MARMEAKLRVEVPTEFAYELWSRPQEYPNFMGGVTAVRSKGENICQLTIESTDRKEHWTVKLANEPPRFVRWRNTEGGRFLGEVMLRTTAEGTEVTLIVDYEPQKEAEENGRAADS